MLASGTAGPSAYWYLTRSTGAVSLLLLTLSLVLGVVDVSRWHSPRWPRFALDSLHRNVSMLAMVFLGVHILTSVLDSFAPVSLVDAVLPFIGSYRPLWLGLGAVAFDLLLAVFITSMMRQRLGYRAWRITHWLAYASWPIAVVHTLGTGSDVKGGWLLALTAACLLAALAAVAARAIKGWPARARLRCGALATAAVVPVGLLLWLPGGPLGKSWARRAGTPVALLGASASSGSKVSSAAAKLKSQSDAFGGPFHADFSGTIKQQPGPGRGFVTVNIATTFSGPSRGQLDIAIEGQALGDGGVALHSSRVTLGSSSTPALYLGRIVELSGNHIVATARRRDGHSLSLDISLESDPAAGTVSGTVASSPA
jgi:hypothetical protein